MDGGGPGHRSHVLVANAFFGAVFAREPARPAAKRWQVVGARVIECRLEFDSQGAAEGTHHETQT
jgi:hypothetical protein